jgi:hypothetical protein
MASASAIKLAAVEPYLDPSQSAQTIAAHYNEPLAFARIQLAQSRQLQIDTGF